MKSVAVDEIQVPKQLDEYMRQFVDLFPHGVTYEKETRSATPIKPFSFGMRVTHAFIAFATEFADVTNSLDLVLADFRSLAGHPPISAKEGERRYFLLTRVFFYELLRIKDSFPRFLKKMEDNGLLTREQRISSKKMIEDWMKEHYLIRNTYLHGHTMPKNESEFDLSLIAAAHDLGYAPELVPLDGSEKKAYPEFLVALATKRHDLFLGLGNAYVKFFQAILDTTAAWSIANKLPASSAQT